MRSELQSGTAVPAVKKYNLGGSHRATMWVTKCGVVIAMWFSACMANADEAAFFDEYIEPLLKEHCYECHSHESGDASGGLVLDSQAGWSVGGDSGPAVVPNQLEKSILWKAVTYKNESLQMPPEGKLTDAQLTLIKRWIESGAIDPRTSGKAAEKKRIDIEAGRQWWSFQPLRSDTHAELSTSRRIDQAIQEQLNANGLNQAPAATRKQLLRRLTYDLTGLPPSYFTLDNLPYEEVVDRLLDSPQFGEKWGRHWLDVARYADSNGSSFNPPFQQAWRYRNWVINSMNQNMPIDRFIRMQVAGDLLPYQTQAERDDNLIATGYLMLGSKVLGTFDKEQLTLDVIDEQVDTLGKSLIGMTLGCARCHDHKFDPIPQSDYYALAGIFASTTTLKDRLGGPKEDESDWSRRGLGEGGDERLQSFLEENRYAWIKATGKRFQAAKKLDELTQKMSAEDSKHAELAEELKDAKEAFAKADQTLRELQSKLPPFAMAVADDSRPSDVELRIRGVAGSKGDSVPRGFLQVASYKDQPSVNTSQSGRLELAQWLTSEQNSLTARVFVNRVWKHLFREGLVRSVDNFGTTGDQPTHPELLDALATRFIGSGWQLKPLVRDMVLSKTYQQSVRPFPENDPENKLLSSQNRRRMEPEEIRDTLLVLSEQLDPTQGRAMLDSLPIGDVSNLGDYLNIQDQRRTIYQPVIRTLESEVLQLFDSANNAMVTGARPRTVVAPQALYFMNSRFVQDCSVRIAAAIGTAVPAVKKSNHDGNDRATIRDHHGGDHRATFSDVVTAVFKKIVGRDATDAEQRLLVSYLAEQADGPEGLTQHDVVKLCQAILGSTQFQFVE